MKDASNLYKALMIVSIILCIALLFIVNMMYIKIVNIEDTNNYIINAIQQYYIDFKN